MDEIRNETPIKENMQNEDDQHSQDRAKEYDPEAINKNILDP